MSLAYAIQKFIFKVEFALWFSICVGQRIFLLFKIKIRLIMLTTYVAQGVCIFRVAKTITIMVTVTNVKVTMYSIMFWTTNTQHNIFEILCPPKT